MSAITTLINGLTLFNDSFWRGWGAVLGLVPLHHVPVVETDANSVLDAIDKSGGFGFGVMRNINPPFYQKQIDGVTRSPWGHAVMLIGEKIGEAARREKPDLMDKKISHRWNKSHNGPIPLIEGIDLYPNKFEIVESQMLVAVSDLTNAVQAGEQIVIFTNPNWTMEQKVNMALEAYSWVGEPYDVFEIAKYVIPIMFNPSKLKVCSSLVAKILTASGPAVRLWYARHGLNIEQTPPRDIFAYGSDCNFNNHCFLCRYDDVLDVEA